MNEHHNKPFGDPELLQQLRDVLAAIERLPASEHATGLSILVGDAAFAMQQLQMTGDHYWPRPADEEASAFLAEVAEELRRARAKFPGDRLMTVALAEEFGELCKAALDEDSAAVWKEAVQTAAMAARVALDGDGSVKEWRAEKGLDALTRSVQR